MSEAAPDAVPPDVVPLSTYQPTPFQVRGRIGRLRFMAYAALAVLPYCIPAFAHMFDLIAALPRLLENLSLIVASGLVFVVGVRRLNDLEMPWWVALLLLQPLLNEMPPLVWLLLFPPLALFPGHRGANRYGPPAGANNAAVVAGAVLLCAYPSMMLYWLSQMRFGA